MTKLKLIAFGVPAVIAIVIAITQVPPAFGAHHMETIVQDDALLLHRPSADVDASMAQLAELGVDRVRLTASWSLIAPSADGTVRPAFDAEDPAAYPAHRWDHLDRAVSSARAHGLSVDIDIAFWAPLWATRGSEPGRARTDVDAVEYARFARAVALRYSGTFVPPDENAVAPAPPSGDASWLDKLLGRDPPPPPPPPVPEARQPLPAVRMYTIWNEPNLAGFLEPQWERHDGRWVPSSPHQYRQLLRAGYAAVKAVSPENTVLVGGLSSIGRRRGPGGSVAPLLFLRELACVDAHLRPLERPECRGFTPVPGDGFAHHPYSLAKRPDVPSANPDHATISELGKLTDLLDALVDRGRLAPGLRDVWLTEFGYETNTPVTTKPFSLADQAEFLPWSEYLAWRNPQVRSTAQFLLRDIGTQEAIDSPGSRAFGSWQTGLLFEDGRPKPALDAFRVSVHAERRISRRGRQTTLIWVHVRAARSPTAVRIEQGPGSGTWKDSHGRVLAGRAGEGLATLVTDDRGYGVLSVRSQPGKRFRVSLPAHAIQAIAVRPVRRPR